MHEKNGSELERLANDSFRQLCAEADYEADAFILAMKNISRSMKNQGKTSEQITATMEALRGHYLDRIATAVF